MVERVLRTKAELVAGKGDPGATSWRVPVGRFWDTAGAGVVFLVPEYDDGYIKAIREGDWDSSDEAKQLERLEEEMAEEDEAREASRLRRRFAGFRFQARASAGKLRLPKHVVWLIARDNDLRDVTLVFTPPAIEIWASCRWQDYLSGHLFLRGG